MGKQLINLSRNEYENNILDLEKKYFNLIEQVVCSKAFIHDLKMMEKEISENYSKFEKIWDLKNKVKVPAERVVRHHLYTQMNEVIRGIFPSPVSSDFGIRTEDAVICVDVKTIDTKGNPGDLKDTCVEKNQTSFDNKKFPHISMPSNLNMIDDYKQLPVLTYIIKIVYTDNKYQFSLSRDKYPTIVLVNIPNGKLSRLFDFNIIANVKTYDYHKNEGDYAYIKIDSDKINDFEYIDIKCNEKGLVKIPNTKIYYESVTGSKWWLTTKNNIHYIMPVKGGSSVRYKNDILKERFDSKNNPWIGYKEWKIDNEKE